MKCIKQSAIWLLPLIALLAITPWLSNIDIAVSSLFFKNGFSTNLFFDALYDYGNLFSQIICTLAGLGFLLSYKLPSFIPTRTISLVMVASYVLGAGFLGHFLLKDHWGRARPCDITEFHGKKQFTPYYKPCFSHPQGKSFPSGHAISGFYFFCLFFLAKRYQRKDLAIYALLFTLFVGISLSYARISQGGHFFSDTLISALIMWEIAFVIDRFVYESNFATIRKFRIVQYEKTS